MNEKLDIKTKKYFSKKFLESNFFIYKKPRKKVTRPVQKDFQKIYYKFFFRAFSEYSTKSKTFSSVMYGA